MGLFGGGSKKATQTTTIDQTQRNSPWDPAAPLLEGMVKSAQGAYDATPKTPIFTGPNAQQTGAQDYLGSFLPLTSQGYGPVAQLAGATVAGDFLPKGNLSSGWSETINPYLKNAITAAINPLRDQLDANVLSIGDAAKLAGAYGGDRQELLKGTALSRFNRDAMDVGSNLSYNATEAVQQRAFQNAMTEFAATNALREAERGRQMQAGSLFDQANQLGMTPAQIMASLGDQTQSWDMASRQAAQEAPWAGLDKLGSIANLFSPYGTTNTTGTNTTVTQGAKPSAFSSGVGGALGGASAGSAFGPWGSAIGAVVGGLGGLFG